MLLLLHYDICMYVKYCNLIVILFSLEPCTNCTLERITVDILWVSSMLRLLSCFFSSEQISKYSDSLQILLGLWQAAGCSVAVTIEHCVIRETLFPSANKPLQVRVVAPVSPFLGLMSSHPHCGRRKLADASSLCVKWVCKTQGVFKTMF